MIVDVDGNVVETIRIEGADRSIEFRVTVVGGERLLFAVVGDFDDEFIDARISMAPGSGDIPVRVMLWALDYARGNF
ncbi:hypothetical protein [Kutzneria kofuensis]|uniref:Uncharacterized protein n=1 Tax=Kutzneria kofuensis TaxID=103725 RepID=A0A7W9KFW9_9PSEU|nr:hypothetical protein [Kutzneria kofuensis]MBB5891408.1 hypothetical protein [Kutzneria kofuensis]